MKYENILKAEFISRENRFIASILVNNKAEICHVKNTGRLKELLTRGAKVYVQHHADPNRKTKYSLIAVEKNNNIINIDSQCPNKLFYEKSRDLFDFDIIKPEYRYKDSRFDFFMKKDTVETYVEIKGVTLIENDTAFFPDAPSQRAIKHIEHLIDITKSGNRAYIIFIVQADNVKKFSPNRVHKDFTDALKKAKTHGVEILSFNCQVESNEIYMKDPVEVVL